MNKFEIFLQLHHAATPLLLGNCWDVSSAKLLEENGFKAIGTSSAALARSLGYEDGENLPFDLLMETVKRIQQNIAVPLSVDMEKGYGTTASGILENILKLHDVGVAGINIEDSRNKVIGDAAAFAKTISSIADHLAQKNISFFINARTDAFVVALPNALDETITRIKLYQNTGASGIFVPFIKTESDIKAVTTATTLPVNVLATPGLPGIAALTALGVKRISIGSALFNALKKEAANKIKMIMEQQSYDPLF